MNWWNELGIERDTGEILSRDNTKRTLIGLKYSNKNILETRYQKVSDPIYDSNMPDVAFGVVESHHGRCGIFCVKVPYDAENISIQWLPEEVNCVKKIAGGRFWLYDIIMRPVWAACWEKGVWSFHAIS